MAQPQDGREGGTGDGGGGGGLRGGWNRLLDGSNALGAALICLIMLLMCADVALRNFAAAPLPGVSDIVSSAIVAVVFLELPAAVRNGRLTRAELIFGPVSTARPGIARGMETVFMIAGAACCFAIAWWSWPRLEKSWTTDEFVGIVGILTFPRWPVQAVVFGGSLLAGAQFALNAVRVAMGIDPVGPGAAEGDDFSAEDRA